MLSPTDIHYLVGILSTMYEQEDIDVILGDMVYNEASKTDRDVDVTITYKDAEGNAYAIAGIEVKDHAEPLGSNHVEQLCAKLNTHPSLTKRSIVSASGYTKPAKNVARYNGVELLQLKEWDNRKKEFEHVDFSQFQGFLQQSLVWVSPPHVTFNPDQPLQVQHGNLAECQILDRAMNPFPLITKVSEYVSNLLNNVLNNSREDLSSLQPNKEQLVVVNTTIADEPYVIHETGAFQIKSAKIVGKVKKEETRLDLEFKVLVKDDDESFKVGCVITELTTGLLIGMTTSNDNKAISAIVIPVSDRLKEKVYKHKIR